MSDYRALRKISKHYPVHPMSHHSGHSVTEEWCSRSDSIFYKKNMVILKFSVNIYLSSQDSKFFTLLKVPT